MSPHPGPDFAAYEQACLADGFDEVLVRDWPPGAVVPTHHHPFALRASVVAGEMWLGAPGAQPRHLMPGDEFSLAAGALHDERYGPAGATFWVARRQPGPA